MTGTRGDEFDSLDAALGYEKCISLSRYDLRRGVKQSVKYSVVDFT
jgi:hypothetical protein